MDVFALAFLIFVILTFIVHLIFVSYMYLENKDDGHYLYFFNFEDPALIINWNGQPIS